MTNRKSLYEIGIISLVSIILMYVVETIFVPGYLYKSLIKIVLFLVIPLSYAKINKEMNIKEIFKINNKKSLFQSLILGILVYLVIVFAYLILKNYINLDSISDNLSNNMNINKNNFIYVALYISFINSLLEEFFFRGFICLNLNKFINLKTSYILSSLSFAIYHVGIMGNWFNPVIFVLAMLGLFIGGLIFNCINQFNKNIYGSWIIHMMANFGVNTIGFIMFGII